MAPAEPGRAEVAVGTARTITMATTHWALPVCQAPDEAFSPLNLTTLEPMGIIIPVLLIKKTEAPEGFNDLFMGQQVNAELRLKVKSI